jgi:hypothetical protein
MCTQIDKKWDCGHYGFHNMLWCHQEGCRGPSPVHKVVRATGICGLCVERARNAAQKASRDGKRIEDEVARDGKSN